MTNPGQAPAESPSRPGRTAVWYALRVLLALPVLGVLAILGLSLRLSAGPVDITGLAHRLAPATVSGDALTFGPVRLDWPGFGMPITIAVETVSLRDPDRLAGDHHAADLIDRATLAFNLPSLLTGTLSIEQARIEGATLLLRRDRSGALRLDTASARARSGSGSTLVFDHLRSLRIDRATLSVRDLALGRNWRLTVPHATLHPQDSLAGGRFDAILTAAGQTIRIAAHSTSTRHVLVWHLSSDALVPSALAGLLPALSPLAAVSLPIAPLLDVSFVPGSRIPGSARLVLSLGPGSLSASSGSVPIAAGAVTLLARRSGADGMELTLDQARLALRPPPGSSATSPATNGDPAPVFTGHATLSIDHALSPKAIRIHLAIDSARIGFAGLGRYWPAGLAAGARRWIVANVTAGQATGLHVETDLSGTAGWSSLSESGRIGGFDASGLTIDWLGPMPPLRAARLHLAFEDTGAVRIERVQAILPVQAVGPEAQRLAGARPPQPIAVSDGGMTITGLDGDTQIGTIAATLTGDLGDLLTALANPRLSLLSRHPVPFEAPSGHAVTTLNVRLPLDDAVKIAAIDLSAQSRMTGVHLGDVADGLSLDAGDLSITASTDGLSLGGTGTIAGIDSRLHYAMDFRDGDPDQVVEQATVSGTVTPAVLIRLGLAPGAALSGSGDLDLAYQARRDGRSTIQAGLDMTGLGVALPVWSKHAGVAAQADATILLDRGTLVSVGPIHADGPGLSFQASIVTPPGQPRRLSVQRFLVGRTRGSGEVVFPALGAGDARAPIRIVAHGPALDLSAIVDSPLPPAAKASRSAQTGPSPSGPGWVADLDFARVFVGRHTSLSDVSGHLENDGRRIQRAHVTVRGPTALSLKLEPDGNGRRLSGSAEDTGALLKGLDVTDVISGGPLRLQARVDDRIGGPLIGTVEIGRFVVPDAPMAARIARDVSVYGLLFALPAPQLSIDRLTAPFSLHDDVFTLTDARAHAAALGLTMNGRIDLGRQVFDLHGTVVPAWLINQLPGRLPLVGRLLSPEKGGGVIAATLAIQGPFDDPDIHLNPLSALAPGFLRKLFFE